MTLFAYNTHKSPETAMQPECYEVTAPASVSLFPPLETSGMLQEKEKLYIYLTVKNVFC